MIAILIECDNTRSLGGSCERDLVAIRNKLLETKMYGESNIHILTNNKKYFIEKKIDNVTDNRITNFISALKKVTGHLYVHVSGHGYLGPDIRHVELDGRCEQIFISSGVLTDYMFYDYLKQYVQQNATIRVTVDTCHSGTFSNFSYQIVDKKINASRKPNPYFTDAYSMSACADNQTDSCDVGAYGYGGGLSCQLVECNNLSDFLSSCPLTVRSVRDRICPALRLLRQDVMLLTDH